MKLHVSKTAGALLLLAVLATAWLYRKYVNSQPKLWQLQGQTMGGISYQISYLSQKKELKKAVVDSLLKEFNYLFSTYLPYSEISRFNREDTLSFGSLLWTELLDESKWAYNQSKGAFDPTVGPLTEAWGFGPNRKPTSDTSQIELLLSYVGFDKLNVSQKGIGKKDPRLRLDLSAIAKGYAVDLLTTILVEKSIQNYMIEIGGELRVDGYRIDKRPWRIGIQDPLQPINEASVAVLEIPKGGLATSGNYRNIRKTKQSTYAHTLDPRKGRPVSSNILSATIWSTTSARADALATACIVLGFQEALSLINHTSQTEALFFYVNEESNLRSYLTPGLRDYVSALRYDSIP